MFSKRMKPSFMIIGGVKCGSTSLYRYLIEHPNVLPGKFKEPFFFSNRNLLKALLRYPKYITNYPKLGKDTEAVLNWPILNSEGEIEETVIRKNILTTENYITGEASATYNFSAKPKVIKTLLPKTKIIFILRNPTDRFISHWKMFRRFHKEGRPGYDVGELIPFIETEISRYKESKDSRILHQGLYYNIIKRWRECFDENQMMTLRTNDLNNPTVAKQLLNEINRFLDLPDFDYSNILSDRFNVAPKSKTDDRATELLNSFYEESNTQLLKELNIKI